MPTIKITIIGGGFSGAMTAYHLLRQEKVACAITIVEPALSNRGAGLGLAYSTALPVASISSASVQLV